MPLQTIDLSKLEGESLRQQVQPQALPKEVMRARLLRLALRGQNARQAAQACGYAYDTVRRIYADPAFQADFRKRVDLAFEDVDTEFIQSQKSLADKVSEKANTAFTVLCELLESEQTLAGHKIKIAQDILDRTAETATFSPRTTALDADKLRAAALAARDMDNVIPIRKKA